MTTRDPRNARLLFVLDNDYGELSLVMHLLDGQDFANKATLLLPRRLYTANDGSLSLRARRYDAVEDVDNAIETERPDLVFLMSAYQYPMQNIMSLAALQGLVARIRNRGCMLVTSDPYFRILDETPARPFCRIEHPGNKSLWTKPISFLVNRRLNRRFSASARILRDLVHLYPVYPGSAEEASAPRTERNVSFINPRMVVDEGAIEPGSSTGEGGVVAGTPHRRHWLFILGSADFVIQTQLYGSAEFAQMVGQMLMQAIKAGRKSVLLAPSAFIETVSARLADCDEDCDDADLRSYCSYEQFAPLLIEAEYAFYWNVASFSIAQRLMSALPVFIFDRGHLVRQVDSRFYDRLVQWFYQGREPLYLDQRVELTADGLAAIAGAYRATALDIRNGLRRSPAADELVESLLQDFG